MDAKITAILERMKKQTAKESVSQQLLDMGQLLTLVAEEESKSAEKVRKQTEKLICLTWALVGLTVSLLLLTAILCYDAHQHH